MRPRFSLGELVATPGAIKFCGEQHIDVYELFVRHARGDWGNLVVADKAANERAILDGTRILSAYVLHGEKLYVITEADRSSTCLLLASEY